MAERIDIQSPESGSEAPNQPIYEGYQPNEPEASPQGQPEPAPSEGFEVPDKFVLEDGSVDVASLARSYSELEKMRSTPTAEEPNDGVSDGNQWSSLSEDNMQRYADEVSSQGQLSEESLQGLENDGIPRDLVDQYVSGMQALANQQRNAFLDPVGGEQGYAALSEWANENLSEAELDAYDAVMNSGDTNQINMNIQGLHARYQQATGRPSLIQGETSSEGSNTGFRSWDEVKQAMRDRRYQTDSAYRQDVTNRLAVSDLNVG